MYSVFSLPWNQRTPLGYAMEMFFSVFNADFYFIVNGAFLLLFISICKHHEAFYKMFEHSLRKYDQNDTDRMDKKSLCDLIRFHILVKEFSKYENQLEIQSFSSFDILQLVGLWIQRISSAR